MRIAVYLSSSMGNKECYKEETIRLGKWIAQGGHTLVYGGTSNGLMGVLADTVREGGGDAIGVVPGYERISSCIHPDLTECVRTEDMATRKNCMIELADAFIALPGGPGTLDELSDILSLTRVGALKKTLVLYDVDGFYRPLYAFLQQMLAEGFAEQKDFEYLLVSGDVDEIGEFVRNCE